MSAGVVPALNDEEDDDRPLPVVNVPPVADADIKITPVAPGPGLPAGAPLASDVSQALDAAVANAGPSESSPADMAAALAAPVATNPLAASPPIPSSTPAQMLPGGTMHIKREVPGTPDQGALDTIDQRRNAELSTIQDRRNEINDAHVETQAQLQANIDQKAADAKAREEHQAELQKQVDAQVAKQQKAFDEYKATPFRDLYRERSTGDKVFGALAMALGGWGGRHNDAKDILDSAMQHAYDKQAADIAGKWKEYEKATGDVATAKAGMHQAMQDLDTLQAARWEVNAAELSRLKEKQGFTAEQLKLDADVTHSNDKADGLKQKVAQDARLFVDESNIDPSRGKKHGGGGGGGGAMASAAEKLALAIKDGVTDANGVRRPLSQDEKIHQANALGIPLEGKAGQITLKTITNESTFENDQQRKAAKGAGAGGGGTLYDPQDPNKPLVTGISARNLTHVSEQMALTSSAAKELEDLADHIEKVKRVGPEAGLLTSQNTIDRLHKFRSAQQIVAKALQYNSTEEAAKREEQNLGGTGVGLAAMTDPKMLRAYAEKVRQNGREKIIALGHVEPGATILGKTYAAGAGGEHADDKPLPAALGGGRPSDIEAARAERDRLSRIKGGGGNGGSTPALPPPERIAKARRAVAPGSGATPAQRASAQALLDSLGGP